MKRVLSLLCFFLSVALHSQDFSVDAYSIVNGMERVYETNTNNAGQKHLLCKEWVAKTFGDYKSVIQFEDGDNHKIILKGFTRLADKSRLTYTITIDSRDDKYRVNIEDYAICDFLLKTSNIIGFSNDEKELLSELGLDSSTPIDMRYLDYISVADDVAYNQRKIDTYKEELVSNHNKIQTMNEKGEEIDYSQKPKGMTNTLFRQKVNSGQFPGASVEQLQKSNKKLSEQIENLEEINRLLKMRAKDVEQSISDLLQTLYRQLNKNENF